MNFFIRHINTTFFFKRHINTTIKSCDIHMFYKWQYMSFNIKKTYIHIPYFIYMSHNFNAYVHVMYYKPPNTRIQRINVSCTPVQRVFPRKMAIFFKNVRDKSHSLDDREHGCPILSQPEGTECTSQRRAIYRCDFPRIAAGKTIFLHLGPPQRSPHRR